MELNPERAAASLSAFAGNASDPRPACAALRGLLGSDDDHALPPLVDLVSSVVALARGTRRKALLPFADTAEELALVRRGEEVRVSRYSTGNPPEVRFLDRVVALDTLLEACSDATEESVRLEENAVRRRIATRLAERARITRPVPFADEPTPRVVSGGTDEALSESAPLTFGFTAEIWPGESVLVGPSARADLHALLFPGTLWAHLRGRRIVLARGPIMVAVERMLAAARALSTAWESGRRANLQLCAGAFLIGVRLERGGEVSLTLGGEDGARVTAAALDVPSATMPILRLASDLLRAMVGLDRSQSRNLRVRALRDDVRLIRRSIRGRERLAPLLNPDPDRLRAEAGNGDALAREFSSTTTIPTAGTLRFAERWSFAVDGLDADASFLCGDRIVLSTSRSTVALSREDGEVLWAREGAEATALMAGRTLLRLFPDGELELCDVVDGEPFATSRLLPRGGMRPTACVAEGRNVPPTAVLTEAPGRLVGIDLRTGEPRWRFVARSGGTVRMQRAGRVLLVTCGDSALHALDVATGEVVWRHADAARITFAPEVHGDLALAISGEAGGNESVVSGLDLYTGRLLFRSELPASPSRDPVAAAGSLLLPVRGQLVALTLASGKMRWSAPDPGFAAGGAALVVDRTVIVNAPGGRLTALDLDEGNVQWEHRVAHPTADEVPRRLEPVLRGGALFVPGRSVSVVRPTDGARLGERLPCDLVSDLVRVDERGWVYIGEESGHLAAYAPVRQLRLIPGGAG